MSRLATIVRAGVEAAGVSFFLALVGNLVLDLPLSYPFLWLAWVCGVAVAAAASRAAPIGS